jgi:membrane associated rhomboid family serine protease
MGIYDRDYYRSPPPRGGFGVFNAWSVTTWLIVVNVGVFLGDGLLLRAAERPQPRVYEDYDVEVVRQGPRDVTFGMGPLERWGYFSTDTAVRHGQAWRFLSFQFLHAGAIHLFGNMLALFLFGPIVEAHYGGRRFLAFYLLCGLAGAASYLILAATHVLVHDPATPMVGASAGIFGLLVAAAMIAPNVQVYVYWGMPLTIRWLAIFGMALAAWTVLNYGAVPGAGGSNAGGEAAHLGGGVLGFLLMKNQHWLNPFAPRRRVVGPVAGRRRPRGRPFQKDWSKDFNR